MTHKNQVRVVWKEVWSFVSSFLKIFLRTVLSHWDFSNWRFRFFPPLKSNCDSHTTQPTVHAGCFSVSIIHQTLTWTSGSLICAYMLMHAIAHRGIYGHTKESLHWKLTLGEKSLASLGNRTCVSSMLVQHSAKWATSTPQRFFFVCFAGGRGSVACIHMETWSKKG